MLQTAVVFNSEFVWVNEGKTRFILIGRKFSFEMNKEEFEKLGVTLDNPVIATVQSKGETFQPYPLKKEIQIA